MLKNNRRVAGSFGLLAVLALFAALLPGGAAQAGPAPDPVAPADLLTPDQTRGEQSAMADPWILVIRNVQSGRCLDADTGTIGGNGTKVQLWDCTNGATEQQWRWLDSDRKLQNVQSGRCLDADTGTIGRNGTKVQLWDCTNGATEQRWSWLGPYAYSLTNDASGRCLDADTGTIGRNGTKVQLWDCTNGATEQQWRWTRVG